MSSAGRSTSRVLMLYQDERLPSSRVRVLNLVPELRGLGIDCLAEPYPRKTVEKLRLFRRLRDYDLVFLQKKLLATPELCLLRGCARRLAFDFDDAIYMRDDGASQEYSKTRMGRFASTARKSDLLIAGNPVLADYARQFHDRVEVVPSAVPYAGIPVKDWEKRDGALVVGWVGGGGNLHHLSIVGSALQQLAKQVDFELRVISDQQFQLEGVKVRNVRWRLETQEAEIARFDVGIMPLPRNAWTEGKCSYKLLQVMAAGIPVVATDWGFNRNVVKGGVNGFLAESPEEFCRYISEIGADLKRARAMGEEARTLVEREYSLAAVAGKLATILKGALNSAAL